MCKQVSQEAEVAYLGAVLCNLDGQLLDDAGVDVEQVVAGHAGLAGNSGRDDHQVSALQACSDVLLPCVACHLQSITDPLMLIRFHRIQLPRFCKHCAT